MFVSKDLVVNTAELVGGKPGKVVAEISTAIIDSAMSKRMAQEQKMMNLQNHNIAGWQYIEIIQKCFVPRKFSHYGREDHVGIGRIKAEVERKRPARNIILTGLAGSGKSTVLKWLYLNCSMKEYSFLYIYAQMFDACKSLEEVLTAICEAIPKETKCLVFFDGLDELKCLKGTAKEFEELVQFFNKKSSNTLGPIYKFIISTRPEHFSFQKMIRGKKLKTNMDNYIVFELQGLAYKGSLRVCKSMEKLSKFDRKEGYQHFIDKWPSSENEVGLTKNQYLYMLKRYLRAGGPLQSLLASPLLCRYAYSIICEWSAWEEDTTKNSQGYESTFIGGALGAYIKWEFHDTNPGIQTADGEGKRLLEEYKCRALAFLTEIAGRMGAAEAIDKKEWEELKNTKGISGNISFCVLQEYGEEQMAFMHRLFKDYFLASYCVKIVENNLKNHQILEKKEFERLAQLMETSSLMPSMYVEQIIRDNNPYMKKILDYLFCYKTKNDFEQLAKLAGGHLSLMYTSDLPFSIEEYLMVFPLGSVKYHGISLNDASFRKLRATGILEVENVTDFLQCKVPCISTNIEIRGVKCEDVFGSEFKYVTRDFKLVYDGMITDIGGYWHFSMNRKEIEDILLHSNLRNKLCELDVAANPELANAFYKEALKIKRWRDAERLLKENLTLVERVKSIAVFMGVEKNFWCLFSGGTLFMLQIAPENEDRMADLFFQGFSKDSTDFSALYGSYKVVTEPLGAWHQERKFREITSIDFKFDTTWAKPIQPDSILKIYYSIHWKNVRLLEEVCEKNRIFDLDDLERMLSIQELWDLYEEVDSHLAQTPNEKLALYISDEKLLTLYIAGKGDEMAGLAEKTKELCEKYQHTEGTILRKRLLSDNLCFKGEDMKKLYAFAKDHIWL